jgi:hypothetical protein
MVEKKNGYLTIFFLLKKSTTSYNILLDVNIGNLVILINRLNVISQLWLSICWIYEVRSH